MKLFDVNWFVVLGDLARFDALPLAARRVLLDELRPTGYVLEERFGQYADVIAASGIARHDAEKKRFLLAEPRRELLKVLRAMHRHPVFDDPSTQALLSYMDEHVTGREVEELGSNVVGGSRAYVDKHGLAPRISFAGWSGDLLAASTKDALRVWAAARGVHVSDLFMDPISTLMDLRALARQLLASPDGMPLRELVASRNSEKERHRLASAIHMGLGTLVLFAGMRRVDLEPMIGLWPTAARDLSRPPVRAPKAASVDDEFCLAVHMEDMTTLLASIAASPVRVRANDSAVFAKTRADIETRLVALPPWVAPLHATARVDNAARELEMRGLVRFGDVNGNPHLHLTPAGSKWLMLSPHDRLDYIVSKLRASKDVNPRASYAFDGVPGFFPYSLPYFNAPKALRLREVLTRAFLDAPSRFISVTGFIEHNAINANPFVNVDPSSASDLHGMAYYNAGDPRETYGNVWRDMLYGFLTTRLIGLGGASVGRQSDGTICFSLTDVGRYLLGAAESFEYGSSDTADIVVQPNFDVVFLGAAPSIEAEVARFAQRVGVAPGLVFKLTRASVLAAAEAGVAVGDVIGALTRASSKPVPKNVQREIAGWMDGVRRAVMRKAELLECADTDTATRIASLLGAKVRQLTPTVFELPALTPATRAAMVKKLRAGGVFLDNVTVAAEPKQWSSRRMRLVDPWDDEQ